MTLGLRLARGRGAVTGRLRPSPCRRTQAADTQPVTVSLKRIWYQAAGSASRSRTGWRSVLPAAIMATWVAAAVGRDRTIQACAGLARPTWGGGARLRLPSVSTASSARTQPLTVSLYWMCHQPGWAASRPSRLCQAVLPAAIVASWVS